MNCYDPDALIVEDELNVCWRCIPRNSIGLVNSGGVQLLGEERGPASTFLVFAPLGSHSNFIVPFHIPHHRALAASARAEDCPIFPLPCTCGPPGQGLNVAGIHKVTYVAILEQLIDKGVLRRGSALFNDALSMHYAPEVRSLLHRHGINGAYSLLVHMLDCCVSCT